jgi:hypothetical protein
MDISEERDRRAKVMLYFSQVEMVNALEIGRFLFRLIKVTAFIFLIDMPNHSSYHQ